MPPTIQLVRVPHLDACQRALAAAACLGDPGLIPHRLLVVPSASAAEQLRQTVESLLLVDAWRPGAAECAALGLAQGVEPPAAVLLPRLVTRAGLYRDLHERRPDTPPRLIDLARNVLFARAAREVQRRGIAPPFPVRPGLLAEMLDFYDALRRLGHPCAALTERVIGELAASAAIDRGASRLLEQTRFLAATFAAYEALLADVGSVDEHMLRDLLVERPGQPPVGHVIVAVGDHVSERGGLWPADYALLQRLPGLDRVDIVATEAVLASGVAERLRAWMPDLATREYPGAPRARVTLVAPPAASEPARAATAEAPRWFVSRDREEELLLFARRIKTASGVGDEGPLPALDRIALVYHRPLPYLYVSRQIFGDAGIPCQAFDTLPLASEPYAAALDLVLEAVSSSFVRTAIVALLRSPHFCFDAGASPTGDSGPAAAAGDAVTEEGNAVTRDEIAAFDRALADAGYLGGRDHLRILADRWSREAVRVPARGIARAARAARAALRAADALASLEDARPPSVHLDVLLDFLRRHDVPGATGPDPQRDLRSRAAIVGALEALRDAHRWLDDEPAAFADLEATLHRWIEAQTFQPRAGRSGVHLVDAEAARFGRFSSVHVAGLVEGEWPEAPTRNVFFPASLLADLGWAREADRRAAARAAFGDLLRVPEAELSVSTFLLEQDALVSASSLLEELADLEAAVVRPPLPATRVALEEALSLAPIVPQRTAGTDAADWLALRLRRAEGVRAPGAAELAEPPVAHPPLPASERVFSVTAVERYLQCPFKYFAAYELGLEPDAEEEPGLSALERGRIVHQVLHDFFARWRRAGRTDVTVETIEEARRMFAAVVDEALSELPEPDRTLEHQRFFGTVVSTGYIDRVLRAEIAQAGPVAARLVEHPIDGRYRFELAGEERWVRVRGVVDRVDLLQDAADAAEPRRLRVIDYKTGRAPRTAVAVQPQIYGLCLEQQLARERGGDWRVAEAGYLALGQPDPPAAAARRGDVRAQLADATARFLGVVDGIERGDFRVTPAEPFLCIYCAFPTVCRKDYVGDD